jgi:hypothetical protein
MFSKLIPFRGILCCGILTLLFSFSPLPSFQLDQYTPAATDILQVHVEEGTWEDHFTAKVEMWIAEIQQKDPLFAHWQQATWKAYPFGPGSRQWVILMTVGHQEVGYLIVGDHDGLELIEYGFTTEGLLSQLVEDERMREHFFYHGLVWGVLENGVIRDLITGEHYDHVSVQEVDVYVKGVSPVVLSDVTTFDQTYDAIALYNGKYTVRQAPASFEPDLEYVYFGSLLPRVTGVFNIFAAHEWQRDAPGSNATLPETEQTYFLAIADMGLRFFPLDTLLQFGEIQAVD